MGRKNTGSIRYRGDFQFRASVTISGREISQTFSTRVDAEVWIEGLQQAESVGRTSAWLAERNVTLGEALKRYLTELTPHKKSAAPETRNIEAFLRREIELCAKPFHEVRTSDIKSLIQRRMKPIDGSRPISGSTMNRTLAFLSHLFTVASADWDYTGLVNPIIRGIRRRENRARERRLEGGEEAALLAAARAYERVCEPEIPITAVIEFSLATAMRLGEIGCCQWAHVNLQQATILLPTTKNGSARSVPLWPRTVRLLSGLNRRGDGLVFGPPESIRLMFSRVLRKTEIKGFRFHDLRHEGVSRLFELTDLSDMEIAMISGHKTLSMLKRYTHLRANKLARRLAACEERQPLALVGG